MLLSKLILWLFIAAGALVLIGFLTDLIANGRIKDFIVDICLRSAMVLMGEALFFIIILLFNI